MLCALGVVVLAAEAAQRWHSMAALLAAFLGALVLSGPERLPDASLVGTVTAGAVALRLFAPRQRTWIAVVGGILCASWVALFRVQGLPLVPALLIPAALAGLSAALARRRAGFATQVLRDEGLLVILIVALTVAMLPAVLEGWRSAAAMNGIPAPEASTVIPMWTWAVVAGSSVLGVVHTWWSRR